MRYFRVYTGRYGGELTVGKISDEEFERFNGEDSETIIEEFSDWDRETPWHEIDDLEHLNAPYSDCDYYVQEETADGDWIGPQLGPFQYNHLYGREVYCSPWNGKDPEEEARQEKVNVLQFFSEEKGGFGDLLIETEEDFDPSKLRIGVAETELAMLIDSYYYNKVQIEPDYDSCDTIGKGYHAFIGTMYTKWHDRIEDIDFEEAFEYMDE